MQFLTTSSLLLVSGLAALVAAQNPFTFNPLPTSIKVGEAFNITWSPSTGTQATVTIMLRQGDPDHLADVEVIASE